MSYIEKRPEAIEAIHKCITGKWNPICMCFDTTPKQCDLCILNDDDCMECSLFLDGEGCNEIGSVFQNWNRRAEHADCSACSIRGGNCDEYDCPRSTSAPDEAEAMLEALVQLLPLKERKRYEP